MSNPEEIKEELAELSLETADITMQLLANSEIFDQIPILSSLYKIGKTIRSIPDILFFRKLQRFIILVNEKTSLDAREDFAKKIKENKRDADNLYEYILLKIDNFDDTTKPEIFAKIFACFLTEKIREEEYDSLSYALTSSSLANLRKLSKEFWTKGSSGLHPGFRNLLSSGLVGLNLNSRSNDLRFQHLAPVPKPTPFSAQQQEVPYGIGLYVADLGKLFAYISEDFEDHFNLDNDSKYEFPYKFDGDYNNSELLKAMVKERWGL